jgi:hypothetical protein
MTNDPVLHALIDLVQALEEGTAGAMGAAYTNAVNMIRERTAPGGDMQPEDGGITQALVQMARDNAIEECARLCEAQQWLYGGRSHSMMACQDCAQAIRKHGGQP